MTTPFDCTLNSVPLSSLDESICVLDVREPAPKLRLTTLAARSGGLQLLERQRESISVEVSLAIHEPDPIRRKEVFHSVLAWAEAGGTLTISDRPEQQLQVICSQPPEISADEWMTALKITFTSTRVPYWEASQLTQVSTTGTAALTVPGTAPSAPVSVLLVNTGTEAITQLTLHCGSTQMVFDSLTLPAGSIFLMTQSGGCLTAMVDNISVLKYRTPDSDDLLLAPCGKASTVYASAAQPTNANFAVRGRYL